MKLSNKFSDQFSGKGIFHFLNQLNVPWKNDVIGDLDLDYIGNRSGDKEISPLLDKLNPNEPISDANAEKIAKVIYDKYIINWNRLYEALLKEYNPIYNNYLKENEKITEDERVDKFNKGIQTNKDTLGEVNVTIDQGQQTNETLNFIGQQTSTTNYGEIATTDENKVSAFNSSSYQDKNHNTGNTGAHTDTQNVSNREDDVQETVGSRQDRQHTNEIINQYEDGAREDTSTKGKQITTRELARDANLGVRSTQELLMQEYDLRTMYNFWKVVYSNIDEVLVLRVY